jgi:two-component system response regulator AtoC
VERAVILCDGGTLSERDFSFAGADMGGSSTGRRSDELRSTEAQAKTDDARSECAEPLDLRTMERRAIEAALERNGGHREHTAGELGITRRTLLNKMNEYGLR